jgi:hypothetical protein
MATKFADPAQTAGKDASGQRTPTLASSNVLVANPDVCDYLSAYPSLAGMLPSVCEQIRQRLGDAVELSLEVYRDPEIDDRFLALFVRQRSYDESTMQRIREASEPLDEQLRAVDGCLVVTTDFRAPRKPHALPVERTG